ncbi:VWA domain-containing protein [Parendozoicomonas sp. Alg238-R29]|uniref:vWA domain-containing protein n=1 Tax=Parendozoicomonas sp. Alg238-R29 TaxID=2993446 RepID=UPI00248DA102|nr:VWA domain-containing protein [Parendozoicomonas sp. Alg238-R29]
MSMIEQFHFLRPLWLLALIPVLFIGWKLWKQSLQAGQWQKLIPGHLLEHLLEGEQQTRSRAPAILATLAGIIAVIALAGPTWRQLTTPVEKSRAPLVLVVDLSRSMLAADPSPNRLVRAKQKLTDIVRLRKDGLTGLVAYAGNSHVVTPLTDDSATLINMIRALDPSIMPVPGSRPEKAIAQAVELMKQGAGQAGTILLLTDGMEESQSQAITNILKQSGDKLSILGFGTETGAPVPGENGGFQRDRNGAIVMAQLDRDILSSTAKVTGGRYSDLTLDDNDILSLIPGSSVTDETIRVDRSFDSWFDEGRWLVLLLLPLAALAFRRGWVLPVLLLGLSSQPQHSYAMEWKDLWKRPDQQAQALLENGDAKAASETFENTEWKAEALDKSGNYEEAAKMFGQQNTAEGFYNQGNALARAEKLDESLKAYDKALEKNPNLEAAQKNKQIVEDLKKQQQKNNQQQGDQNQNSNDKEQNSDQNQNSENNSDSSSKNKDSQSDSQGSDSQNSNSKNQQQNHQQPEGQKSDEAESEQDRDDSNKSSEPEEQQSQQTKDEQEDAGEQPQPSQPEQSESSPQEQSQHLQDGEQDQDAEQIEAWLRRIPDDPGGLLRRKFEQQQQRQPVQQGEKTW